LKIERRISGAALAPLSFFQGLRAPQSGQSNHAHRKNAFRLPSVREIFARLLPRTAFLPLKMRLQTTQKICFWHKFIKL
jgi:hypothetical protein